MQYLIARSSRPEANSDVISSTFLAPVVADNRLKFGDHRATNWWGGWKATPIKFDPKPSKVAFSVDLRTSINADRKYPVWILTWSAWIAVQHLGIWFKKWPYYFSLWQAESVLRITIVQYLIAFYNRPEATTDVTSSKFVRPVTYDNCVEFGDPCVNLSREISPEAPEAALSTVYFVVASDRKWIVTSYPVWL